MKRQFNVQNNSSALAFCRELTLTLYVFDITYFRATDVKHIIYYILSAVFNAYSFLFFPFNRFIFVFVSLYVVFESWIFTNLNIRFSVQVYKILKYFKFLNIN